MKTKNFKRPIALFLAVVLCAAMLFSMGTTAFAAEETANVCLIAFPRDGDTLYRFYLSNHSWQTGSCGQAKCHTASWHRQKYSRTSRS